jgi:hypothetical protein
MDATQWLVRPMPRAHMPTFLILNQHGSFVAKTYAGDWANLIAAAPQLLLACEKAIETMHWALDQKKPKSGSTDPCVMACQDLSDSCSMLRAAMDLAQGKVSHSQKTLEELTKKAYR